MFSDLLILKTNNRAEDFSRYVSAESSEAIIFSYVLVETRPRSFNLLCTTGARERVHMHRT